MPRKPKRPKNTYKLPTGDAIRRELIKMFRAQKARAFNPSTTGIKSGSGGDDWWLRSGFDPRDGTEEEFKPFIPLIQAIWERGGRQALAEIGLDPDAWNVTDPNIQEAIRAAAFEFCAETNATTAKQIDEAREELRESILEGMSQGDALSKMVDRVESIYSGAERWRSRRIAMTEAMRGHHAAMFETARQSGVVVGLRWLLSGDACERCHDIANKVGTVRLGENFALTGSKAAAYSEVKYPPAHPFCACSCEQVLMTEENVEYAMSPLPPPGGGGGSSLEEDEGNSDES